jgi:hypothetical protein
LGDGDRVEEAWKKGIAPVEDADARETDKVAFYP